MKPLLLSACLLLGGCTALTALLPALGGGTSTKGHGNDNTLQFADTIKSNTLSSSKDFSADNIHGGVYQHETNHGYSSFDMVMLVLLMSIVPSWIPYRKIGKLLWTRISTKK